MIVDDQQVYGAVHTCSAFPVSASQRSKATTGSASPTTPIVARIRWVVTSGNPTTHVFAPATCWTNRTPKPWMQYAPALSIGSPVATYSTISSSDSGASRPSEEARASWAFSGWALSSATTPVYTV